MRASLDAQACAASPGRSGESEFKGRDWGSMASVSHSGGRSQRNGENVAEKIVPSWRRDPVLSGSEKSLEKC